MNPFLEQLKKEIIAGVHPDWNRNQKLRYVYMMAGKKLTKDATFFYSLSAKLGNASLSYEELKRKYVENGVDENEVICKSTSLFLKSIYEELGIEVKLMKSAVYQRVYSEDKSECFDVYHYFLCCTGEEDKKYFLTLSSDLMNIQNNWQTEHFASTIGYQLREVHGKTNVAYQGEPIQESTMSLEELLALDDSIGLVPMEKGTQLKPGGALSYYENAISLNSVSLVDSPFIYQRAKGLLASRKGYAQYLNQNSEFYKKAFVFQREDGSIISLNDTPLSELSEKDIDDWNLQMLENMPEANEKVAKEAIQKIEIIAQKLKRMRKRAIEVKTMEEGEEKRHQILRLKKDQAACHNLLHMVSYLFVPSQYKDPQKGNEISTDYLQYRFENLFVDFMMFNKEEPSMLSRCNGLAEKIELLDRVLMDLFGGDVFSKTNEDAKLSRSVALNRETGEYHLFFQLNNTLYYHLDLDTGKLKILPDVVGYISNQSFEFISDSFHAQILDIEESISKK